MRDDANASFNSFNHSGAKRDWKTFKQAILPETDKKHTFVDFRKLIRKAHWKLLLFTVERFCTFTTTYKSFVAQNQIEKKHSAEMFF